MAGPVGDDRLQRRGLARQLEHEVGDLLNRTLDAGPDVVRLALAALLENEVDRATVIVDVQPLASVLRRRVERQLAVVERVREEERNHLLRELIWPAVVAAVRDGDRKAERLEIGPDGG